MSSRASIPFYAPWGVPNKSSLPQNARTHHSPVYGQLTSAKPTSSQPSISTSGATYSVPPSPFTSANISSRTPSPTTSEEVSDYMSARWSSTVDPLPFDRVLASQAQTSGALQSHLHELAQLQALATSRLGAARANFADGIAAARDVSRELEDVHGRVERLNARAARRWPEQMRAAEAKFVGVVEREY
ncbi:hypothetical protein MBLNU459_g4441t1 [Dothideomycetes sp. NU459]